MVETEINGKKYQIKELTYLEAVGLEGLTKGEMAKKMLVMGAGLSEEDMAKLTLKEGIELQKAINEVNKLDDFQKPIKE